MMNNKPSIRLLAARLPSMFNAPHFCLEDEDMPLEDCDTNPNGIKTTAHYCAIKNFLSIAEPTTEKDATDPEEIGRIDTAHTFTSPAGFTKIDLEVDKNSVKHEPMGENGNGNWKNSAIIFIPGGSEKRNGIMNSMRSKPAIWIFTTPDGVRHQIGEEGSPAFMKPMFDTNESSSSAPRGWAVEVVAYSKYSLLYKNDLAITLKGAV